MPNRRRLAALSASANPAFPLRLRLLERRAFIELVDIAFDAASLAGEELFDCGHPIHTQQPEAFRRVLGDFLANSE